MAKMWHAVGKDVKKDRARGYLVPLPITRRGRFAGLRGVFFGVWVRAYIEVSAEVVLYIYIYIYIYIYTYVYLFRVLGFGFRVWGFEFRVQGLGCVCVCEGVYTASVILAIRALQIPSGHIFAGKSLLCFKSRGLQEL